VEEGTQISKTGWKVLLPTVRRRGSQFMVAFNPMDEDDWVYENFITNPRPDAHVVELHVHDNPWAGPELLAEEQILKARDPEEWAHVWCGKLKTFSEASILRGKYRIEAFPDGLIKSADHIAFGMDFGFGSDPCAVVRSFTIGDKLFISDEVVQWKLDMNQVHNFLQELPGSRHAEIACDNSQPGVIAQIVNKKYNAVGVDKWSGSIEDGISWLRSREAIIVHPRCKQTIKEAGAYSRKVDRQSGKVLSTILQGNDHCWDAIRYAWMNQKLISKSGSSARIYERLSQFRFGEGLTREAVDPERERYADPAVTTEEAAWDPEDVYVFEPQPGDKDYVDPAIAEAQRVAAVLKAQEERAARVAAQLEAERAAAANALEKHRAAAAMALGLALQEGFEFVADGAQLRVVSRSHAAMMNGLSPRLQQEMNRNRAAIVAVCKASRIA